MIGVGDESQAEQPPSLVADEFPEVITAEVPPHIVNEAVVRVQAAHALLQADGWKDGEVSKTVARIAAELEMVPGLLFDDSRSSPEDRAINIRNISERDDIWFIGDLHGDLLSLEVAIRFITEQSPDARIVFLGDLFDAGPHGAAVVLRVWERVLVAPSTTAIVAGNHDEALSYESGRFTSNVTPSDLAQWLDTNTDNPAVRAFGETLVRWIATLPRAFFFPDGLLVTHGGFPAADLHDSLSAEGSWNSPLCLQDFIWTRWYPLKRRVRPHRNARDIGLGRENFADFCRAASLAGRPVARLVRGHTHVENCFERTTLDEGRGVLTVVSMCTRNLLRTETEPYVRNPAIARWIPGCIPQVYRLVIPDCAIGEVYPRPELASQVTVS